MFRVTSVAPDRSGATTARGVGRLLLLLVFACTVFACAAVFAVWMPTSIAMPLMRDQGIFAWAGQTILAGGVPYADAWDVKGPTVHLLYALAFVLFGQNEGAIRVFHLLQLSLFGWGAFALFEGLSGRAGATIVAASLAALALGGDPWTSGQPDEWAGMWLVAALALLACRTNTWKAAVAGSLLGAAIGFKLPYVLFALVLLAFARTRTRQLALVAGAALPTGLMALWLWRAGAWSDAFDVLVRYASETARQSTPLSPLHELLGTPPLLAVQVLALVGLIVLSTIDRRRATGLVMMMGASLLLGVVQRKNYLYHFAPYMLACALAAGAGATALLPGDARRPVWTTAVAVVSCLGICVSTLWEPLHRDWNYVAWRLGRRDNARYLAEFEIRDLSRRSIEDVALRVRHETSPGEPIYLWGFDGLLYFLADRPSASRLGFSAAVAGDPDPALRPVRAAEVAADLARVKPRVLVVQETDDNHLIPGGSRAALGTLPVLAAAMTDCYTETFRNRDFTMYARTAACGGRP